MIKTSLKMKRFKTFVFFDIETTGLPHLEYNATKITELCMVACASDTITENKLPRVLHKLSLCFNPFKRIQDRSTEITGLDNFMLENETKFDEDSVHLLSLFLRRLQQPVCLVAHNGNKFDFPILKKHLVKLEKALPEDLWCVDSLPIFKRADAEKSARESSPNQLATDTIDDVLAVPLDENHGTAADTTATDSNKCVEDTTSGTSADIKRLLNDDNDWFTANADELQKRNETTPSHRPEKHRYLNKQRRASAKDERSEITGEVKAKRALFSMNSVAVGTKPKYTLIAVYERLYGEPPTTSHYAESDVITLLKCVVASNKDFVRLAEEEAKLFSAVQSI